MLDYWNDPKIPESPQEQIKEAGINKVSAIGVTEFGAGQFAKAGDRYPQNSGSTIGSSGREKRCHYAKANMPVTPIQ